MNKTLDLAKVTDELTPRERVLLIVHNQIEEEKTGKATLNETDKHALTEGWAPKNNYEIDEYNRFIRGWRMEGFAEFDAQTTFLETQSLFFQEKQASVYLLLYPLFRDARKWAESLKFIKPVNINQALEVVKKQREVKLKGGLDYDYAVYQLAYESLSKPLQEDLQTLYEEVAYDHQYLDQEQALADIVDSKNKLTTEDKNKLADLIVKSGYNSFAKEWQLWQFYASIPLKEIGKRWLEKRGITPQLPAVAGFEERLEFAREKVEEVQKREISKEEALREYTAENVVDTINDYIKDHNTTVEAELKEIVLDWLDNGLLTEYVPLFKSKDTKTYTGNTKLPHDEVFKEWIKANTEAKKTLDNLVAEGKLKREGDILTGDSLCNFEGDYQFIREHNEYVDRYDANLGIVYPGDDSEQKGEHLDRELLITDLDSSGKPYGINFSQIAMTGIKNFFDSIGFVKETSTNDERIIEFSDDTFGELMRNTTDGIKKHYATLLAFKELFEKLSEVYEVDLAYKMRKWLTKTEEFIDSHNEILEIAIGKSFDEIRGKKIVRFRDNWFIDKTKIEPDKERVVPYFEELGEL